jgi:hypothetical protein
MYGWGTMREISHIDISTNPMDTAVRARDAQALVVTCAAPDYVDLIGGSTPDRVRRNGITAFASW